MKYSSLTKLFVPNRGYDEKESVLVGKLGVLSRVYKMQSVQLFSKHNEFFKTFRDSIYSILSSMDYEHNDIAISQTLFVYKNKELYEHKRRDANFFDKENVKFHQSIPQFLTESYITISQKTEKTNIKSDLERFKKNCGYLENIFPLDLEILNKDKLSNIYDRYYNLDLNPKEAVSNNVIRSFLEVTDKNYIVLGDRLIKNYSISSETPIYPAPRIGVEEYHHKLKQSVLSDIIFGSCKSDKIVTSTIFLTTKEKIFKKLSNNSRIFNALDARSSHNQRIKIIEDEVSDLNVQECSINIAIIGKEQNSDEFFDNCSSFETLASKYRLLVSDNPKNNIRQYFINAIGNVFNIDKHDRFYLPMKLQSSVLCPEGLINEKYNHGVHLKTQATDNDVYFNMFQEKTDNKNFFLIGASGSGKSVTLGYFIESFLKDGHTVYLSDIGRSQKGLVEKLGGLFIEVTEQNPLGVNPFTILSYDKTTRKYFFENKDDGQNELDYLRNLFFSCWKSKKEDVINDEQEAVINKTITRYIDYVNSKKNHPSFNGYFLYIKALFDRDDDFKNIDSDIFRYDSYILVLEEFVQEDKENNLKNGRYYYLFQEKGEFSDFINSPFIVFEQEAIASNEKLLTITSFILGNLVKRKMLSDGTGSRFVYIIDEAHKSFSSDSSRKTLEYFTRTFRKHDSSIGLATQELADFTNNKECKAILNNCSIKMFKRQGEGERKEQIQNVFSLNTVNLDLLYSIPSKDKQTAIFIMVEEEGRVYNIKIDKASLIVIKTEKEHRNKLYKELKKHNNNLEAVVKNMI